MVSSVLCTRSAAAAGLLELAAGKRQRTAPRTQPSRRAVLLPVDAPLSAERWAFMTDGARVSSCGRYQAPGKEPRTVCIKGRCAYVQLKGALSRVDELVASAFLSMPSTPGPHELVHLDGDPHNDRADNLQWMTLPEHRAFKADPTRASSQVYKHTARPPPHATCCCSRRATS